MLMHLRLQCEYGNTMVISTASPKSVHALARRWGAAQVFRVFDHATLAAGACPRRRPGASIILSQLVRQYQTLRTGPVDWATIGSAVRSRSPSTADCATSRRSKEALWI